MTWLLGLLFLPIVGLMLRCKCCGGDSCSVFGDTFSDATITGWTQQTGTWSEASGTISTSSNPAILLCDTVHPDGSGLMSVSSKISHSAASGTCDVIVGWVDANNYYYGRYTFGTGASSGTIAVRRVSGGSHSTLNSVSSVTLTAGSQYVATVCVSEAGSISARIDGDAVHVARAIGTTVTGTKSGLGSTGTGTATFDDFAFSKSRDDDNGCIDCSIPCPQCISGTRPNQLQVVITNVLPAGPCDATACNQYNGTFLLDKSDDLLIDGHCTWRYALSGCSGNIRGLAIRINGGIMCVSLALTSGGEGEHKCGAVSVPADCSAFSNFALTSNFGINDYCDFNATVGPPITTVHVTSV